MVPGTWRPRAVVCVFIEVVRTLAGSGGAVAGRGWLVSSTRVFRHGLSKRDSFLLNFLLASRVTATVGDYDSHALFSIVSTCYVPRAYLTMADSEFNRRVRAAHDHHKYAFARRQYHRGGPPVRRRWRAHHRSRVRGAYFRGLVGWLVDWLIGVLLPMDRQA